MANLRERYAEDTRALRQRTQQALTPQRIDQLGRQLAVYLDAYYAAHGQGPTRREALAELDVVEQLAPVPDGMPSHYRRTWQSIPANQLFAMLRWRGWITYTQEPRSLRRGKRKLRSERRPPAPAAMKSVAS